MAKVFTFANLGEHYASVVIFWFLFLNILQNIQKLKTSSRICHMVGLNEIRENTVK